jgi:hypothetical protein
MVIPLGSNLTREFLVMIFRHFKNELEPFKHKESLEYREIMPLHDKIVGRLFPEAMKRTENAIREVLRQVESDVSTYKGYVIDMLVKMLTEVIEGKKGDLVAQTSHIPLHPFFNTLDSMSRMLTEIADVFSYKSYTGAFVTVSVLDSRLQPDREGNSSVEVEVKEASQIYSAWCKLAEQGVCLIGRPGLMNLDIEKMCETFKALGDNLSIDKTLMKLHDNMVLGNISEVSHIIYNAVPPCVEDEGIKALLCEYIAEHFQKLSETLGPSRITNEDIKTCLHISALGSALTLLHTSGTNSWSRRAVTLTPRKTAMTVGEPGLHVIEEAPSITRSQGRRPPTNTSKRPSSLGSSNSLTRLSASRGSRSPRGVATKGLQPESRDRATSLRRAPRSGQRTQTHPSIGLCSDSHSRGSRPSFTAAYTADNALHISAQAQP